MATKRSFSNFSEKESAKSLSGQYITNNNNKKIICKNYLETGECKFNTNCNYAHGIKEQQLTNKRRKAYDLIEAVKKTSFRVTNEYLFLNNSIEDELLILIKICKGCQSGTCYGGLNCKVGAYSQDYLICKDNFLHSKCDDPLCKKIHIKNNNLNDNIDNDNNNNSSSQSSFDNIYDTYLNQNQKKQGSDTVDLCLRYDEYFCKNILEGDFYNANNNCDNTNMNNYSSSSSSNQSSDSDKYDSDDLTYLYENSSDDDDYASIFDVVKNENKLR